MYILRDHILRDHITLNIRLKVNANNKKYIFKYTFLYIIDDQWGWGVKCLLANADHVKHSLLDMLSCMCGCRDGWRLQSDTPHTFQFAERFGEERWFDAWFSGYLLLSLIAREVLWIDVRVTLLKLLKQNCQINIQRPKGALFNEI